MNLFQVMSVSASGMAAQRIRAEYLVENLANSETTRTPEGGPYRRRDVIFESGGAVSPFQAVFQAEVEEAVEGVKIAEVRIDDREPDRRYQPGHPDADERGYVAYPRLNPAEEMVDLLSATRGYQANVAAMTAVKDMIVKSIDLMR